MSRSHTVRDIPIGLRGQDELGLVNHAEALADFIASSNTPITIGIQGEWGTGKTSMMRMIEDSLSDKDVAQGKGKRQAKGSEVFIPIRINTWEHSLINEPTSCLFSIMEEIIIELSKADSSLVNLVQAKQTIMRMAKNAASVGAMVTGGSVDGLSEGLMAPPNIKTLRGQLDNAIKKLQENGREKIIIFIDDLDRLEPATAVKTLELLSNLFAIEGCVFVIAIDYQVVVKGLVTKYGDPKAENEHEFRSFFDKLIQLPFMMPLQSYKVQDYAAHLLLSISYFSSTEIKSMANNQLRLILDSTIGLNPRSIKRLINSLSYLKILNRDSFEQKNVFPLRQTVFALVCFQISFPNVYNLLARNPNFETWDHEFVEDVIGKSPADRSTLNEEIDRLVRTDETLFDEDWEKALFKIVWVKNWQRSRLKHISRILNIISDEIFKGKSDEDKLEIFEVALKITSVTAVNPTDEVNVGGDEKQANQKKLDEALSFWREFSNALLNTGTCFDNKQNIIPDTYKSRSLSRKHVFPGGEEVEFSACTSSTNPFVLRAVNHEAMGLLDQFTKSSLYRGLPSECVERESSETVAMAVSKIGIDCPAVPPRLLLQKHKNKSQRDIVLAWLADIVLKTQTELESLSKK